MRKSIFVLLAVLTLSLMTCGCTDTNSLEEGYNEYNTENTEKELVESQENYVDAFEYDWEWSTSKTYDAATARDGYKYVICNLYINNIGVRACSTTYFNWKLQTNIKNPGTMDGYYGREMDKGESYQGTTITPGENYETQMVYMIPEDEQPLNLLYTTGMETIRIEYY